MNGKSASEACVDPATRDLLIIILRETQRLINADQITAAQATIADLILTLDAFRDPVLPSR